ncbi:hypothetical protein HS7_10470 [Sulfolobales archaeon HS-7]|nr:hypothetical protein HS7_10470 [Sulfolobales archaeon HS-7]
MIISIVVNNKGITDSVVQLLVLMASIVIVLLVIFFALNYLGNGTNLETPIKIIGEPEITVNNDTLIIHYSNPSPETYNISSVFIGGAGVSLDGNYVLTPGENSVYIPFSPSSSLDQSLATLENSGQPVGVTLILNNGVSVHLSADVIE